MVKRNLAGSGRGVTPNAGEILLRPQNVTKRATTNPFKAAADEQLVLGAREIESDVGLGLVRESECPRDGVIISDAERGQAVDRVFRHPTEWVGNTSKLIVSRIHKG